MIWLATITFGLSIFLAYRAMNRAEPTEQQFQTPKSPVVEEGKPLGVVFGRVQIKDPTLYWWGDLDYVEVKR